MNIPYLGDFAVLGESLNYSAAAEKLQISQPTLSRHIKIIEKTLGKPLFDRTTRRVTLSAFGEYLLPYARDHADDPDLLQEAISRWDSAESDVLVIGCSLYSHLYAMTENVIAFRRKYPHITIRPVERPLVELRAEYDEGRFNLITMAYPSDHPVPENMVINGHGRMVAVVPKNDPLAKKPFVRLSDLKKRHLLLPPAPNAFNRAVRQACEAAGFEPDVVSQSRFEANLSLFKEGMGIIIDSRRIALRHSDSDAVLMELKPRMEFYYGLVYREKLSHNEALFVRFVKSRYGY